MLCLQQTDAKRVLKAFGTHHNAAIQQRHRPLFLPSQNSVILCHGFASHKNGFHLPALAEALAKKGLSSLRLDMSGNGESEGRFRYANQDEEAEDICKAVAFLEAKGKKAAGLLGHSKSGSSVLLYSALYGKIPRVVNASGRFDHKRGIKARFGDDVFERMEQDGGITLEYMLKGLGKIHWVFDKQDLQKRMDIDMAKICRQIPDSVKVLTIHGSEDATIPVEDARQFARLLKGNLLLEIEGADHDYSSKEHSRQMIDAAVQFLVHGTI